MKALSLTQPWAQLVAIGEKRFETRSWGTFYRGPIAIHAAKTLPDWALSLLQVEPFLSVLWKAGYESARELPRGCVLAIANLTDCLRIGRGFGGQVTLGGADHPGLTKQELAFGDFSPGRYAWVLKDAVAFQWPVAARGSLGLWEWERPSREDHP